MLKTSKIIFILEWKKISGLPLSHSHVLSTGVKEYCSIVSVDEMSLKPVISLSFDIGLSALESFQKKKNIQKKVKERRKQCTAKNLAGRLTLTPARFLMGELT